MCGIVGYFGPKNGAKIIQEGLAKLSYRGYDSWGIAAKTGETLTIYKQTGDIERGEKLELPSTRVIGHTRWATHGSVTVANAHPHTNESGTIAVVHNGIIENYALLREALIDEDYLFKSQTDTEVIPHLIDYYMKRGQTFAESFSRTLSDLKGSYAILALHADGTLAFARKGSPLCIGIADGEYFISSDIPSFLAHTKNVIHLEDGDSGILDTELTITNYGKPAHRIATPVPWDITIARLGNHKHFMIKEIEEQQRTIPAALNQEHALIEQAVRLIKQTPNLVLAGCGTSYNTCAAAAAHFIAAGKHATPVIGSEFDSAAPLLSEKTLLIAVSQSGETADVLDAVKTAREKGARVIALTNVPSSSLARASDLVIPLGTGPELCVLATKTCTAQLAILTLLALKSAGKDTGTLTQAAASVRAVLEEGKKHAKKLAEQFKDATSLFVLGRGHLRALASEAALKIKEVTYIHAEGIAAGELKHGSIALIEEGTPVIVFGNNETRDLITSNAMEVRARGAIVLGIDSERSPAYDYHIPIPELGEAGQLLQILPVQLLAYELALARGCNPDKPRNLAKSVTVR
ncbi:glutamine--fructose-6-phosphate transaminase (isomerizing) [Candidatus Woesearchaeota archaeon]|nr:MAG: glutamine--fructose-6-phosphate transaminase (isomerizing) [Candidatus Woesearchaeota archaeon]